MNKKERESIELLAEGIDVNLEGLIDMFKEEVISELKEAIETKKQIDWLVGLTDDTKDLDKKYLQSNADKLRDMIEYDDEKAYKNSVNQLADKLENLSKK